MGRKWSKGSPKANLSAWEPGMPLPSCVILSRHLSGPLLSNTVVVIILHRADDTVSKCFVNGKAQSKAWPVSAALSRQV